MRSFFAHAARFVFRGLALGLVRSCIAQMCTDRPGWSDSAGLGCAGYLADVTLCVSQGDSLESNGFTANSACCVCQAAVTTTTTTQPCDALFPSFDWSFESDEVGSCPSGWRCIGAAHIVEIPTSRNPHGSRVFEVGMDSTTGTAISNPILLPSGVDRVAFRRSGGADPATVYTSGSGLYVRSESSNAVLCSGEDGTDTDTMFEGSCSGLASYPNQWVHIYLVDADAGTWGKVHIDDIRFQDVHGAPVCQSTTTLAPTPAPAVVVAPTPAPPALPECNRAYNGYYQYADAGGTHVSSFEECCVKAKEKQVSHPELDIATFSYLEGGRATNCFFKMGGQQDNRGGNWWSSPERIQECDCPAVPAAVPAARRLLASSQSYYEI